MSKKYSVGEKKEVIIQLLNGKTPIEISEITGINKNTIIWWRADYKKNQGTEFPRRKVTIEKTYFKYLDEEIIILARLNPGLGMQAFVNELYSRKRKSTLGKGVRYRITMLLMEHKEDTGEDLYGLLQDPSYSKMVTEEEYRRITGKARLPKYAGRGTGARVSIAQGGGRRWHIPLPPQKFNWGQIKPASERGPRITTADSLDSEEE